MTPTNKKRITDNLGKAGIILAITGIALIFLQLWRSRHTMDIEGLRLTTRLVIIAAAFLAGAIITYYAMGRKARKKATGFEYALATLMTVAAILLIGRVLLKLVSYF